MLPRVLIGILRLRQGDKTDPNIFAAVANVLLAQPHKTGDEQSRTREQSHGKRHLPTDQNFAEPELIRAAARPATAFFQAFDQIRARALQRRVDSHGDASQDRHHNGEAEHGQRKLDPRFGVERQKVRRHFRHKGNDVPRQERTGDSGEHAH